MKFINLKKFNRAVSNFVEDLVPQEVSLLQRKIGHLAIGRIVKRTPTDLGHAKGNWQVTVNYAPTGIIDEKDEEGTNTINKGIAALSFIPPFSVVFITNNVEYIEILEYGGFVPKDPGPSKDPRPKRKGKVWVKGGYSVQSPQGMVAVTLEELRMMFP